MNRRLAASVALLSMLVGLVLLAVDLLRSFPANLVVATAVVLAGVAAWQGLVRTGPARVTSWVAAVVLLVGVVAWVVHDGVQWLTIAAVALLLASLVAGKRAFSVHVEGPAAARPTRAVVVYNVKSGGGKAVTSNLADEARARGIRPRELHPGEDWERVVRDLVADGADGLMAAGGDGTQALVATIAAEHDLPFACIPAGTRNHFALDLGVDRDDVVGALDAFVTGWEKRVDLGEVDGRTFVNNVSMGVYAKAVQQEGYRDAKIRTILATAPTTMASEGEGADALRWTGADGAPQRSAAVVLVSNNTYRLGRVIGSGTRPRLDAGVLGVAVIGAAAPASGGHRALTQWEVPEFTVESDADVPVGLDGEALVLPSPVTFRIRPGVLRVRIAPHHPGASPAAGQPTGLTDGFRLLSRIAFHRDAAAGR